MEEPYKGHAALIRKFGSEEALKAKRREWQKKSRENYTGNGGFRGLSPERMKEIARLGGKARQQKARDAKK